MKLRSLFSLLPITIFAFGVLYATASPQRARRTVGRFRVERNEPVRIRTVRINGQKIHANEGFDGDENWLKSLSVSVKNASRKRIIYASVYMIFPAPPGSGELAAMDEIEYGSDSVLTRVPTAKQRASGIEPDETIEMRLTPIAHDRIRSLLTEIGRVDVTKVVIRLGKVVFADDSSWHAGTYFRRDINDPTTWIDTNPLREPTETVSSTGTTFALRKSSFLETSRNPLLPPYASARFDKPSRLSFPPEVMTAPASVITMLTAPQSAGCYDLTVGTRVCFVGAQCTQERDTTTMNWGAYRFSSVTIACKDVVGNNCGVSSTTLAYSCSSGGSGGSGGGGPEDGGECMSDWDCDFGYSCNLSTGGCEDDSGFGGLME